MFNVGLFIGAKASEKPAIELGSRENSRLSPDTFFRGPTVLDQIFNPSDPKQADINFILAVIA